MASSSSAPWKYDVFLNFRGTDTRYGFASYLYRSLRMAGVNVFMDNRLEKGEAISAALLHEIENSRISVVIFSENYAFSTYCLEELLKIIECRKSIGQVVLPVFYKVDTTDVEELRGSYGKAFVDHEATFIQQRHKVEEWKFALREAVTFSGWTIDQNDKGDAEYIEEIVKEVLKKLNDGKLKRKLQELQGLEAEMNFHVSKQESSMSKKQKHAVENWFRDARRIKNEAESICQEVKVNSWTLTSGGKVENLVQEATKLIEQKAILEGILNASQVSDEAFPTKLLFGRQFRDSLDMILESISSDEASVIGIYGMGGVGKTTLMTHVYNKLLENKHEFPHVYWVTMSQDFNVYKLQSLIAEAIRIKLGRGNDERKRAGKLSKELRKRDKFVLIVDDLWNHFDTVEVGIPIEKNRSKLVITTRSLELCRRMNCHEVKVTPLNEEEGWDLFVKTLEGKLSPNVKMMAKLVVKECCGLPLAIVTMAGSMRGIENLHEWRNVLTELQKSLVRQEDMGEQVFKILRHSYDGLNDPALKQCLLYCALFPEDYRIPKYQLIEYLIVEGIIGEERNTRREKLDKGLTMLNKLEYVCLLQEDGNAVKMHDLVRDMAVQIIKETQPSIIECGKQLREVQDEKHWKKDIIRVSLTHNHISQIPSNFSPLCPNLLTLFLCRNNGLEKIPDSFFDGLQGLRVLDLSSTIIEKLPESLVKLKNLTALFLQESSVSYIPTLADLGCLELLDLSFSLVEKVPEGLESLSNLRYLNLVGTEIEEVPALILQKLSHLQFLAFDKASANAKELGGLVRLETLYWCFPTLSDLIAYLDLLIEKPTRPSKYDLCWGMRLSRWSRPPPPEGSLGHQYSFNGCSITREDIDTLSSVVPLDYDMDFAYSVGLKVLEIVHCDCDCDGMEYFSTSSSFFQCFDTVSIRGLKNLKILFSDSKIEVPPGPLKFVSAFSLTSLYISCSSVKKLFSLAYLSDLQSLQTLKVYDCAELEEIISGEDNSLRSLSNLKNLTLVSLPKLRSICSEEIKCGNLQLITIFSCEELRNIPICLPLPSLEKVRAYEEWWETVKWGDLHQKSSLPVSLT